MTTYDGATYTASTNTYSVDRTGTNYTYSSEGGYYDSPGFDFPWGSNSFNLTVTITYVYTLAPGQNYVAGDDDDTYYADITCNTFVTEGCSSYQPQSASDGLGDTSVQSSGSPTSFTTTSQGTHRLAGNASYNSSNNTVTVVFTITPYAGSANHDQMNWNAVIGMTVSSAQPGGFLPGT